MAQFDMTIHNALTARLEQCYNTIKSYKGKAVVRLDLKKMYDNVYAQYTLLDRILVDCRRQKRLNSAYTLQAQVVEKHVSTLEKRITWANLL